MSQEPLVKLTEEQQKKFTAIAKAAGISLETLQQAHIIPSVCDKTLNQFITIDMDMLVMKQKVKVLAAKDKPVLIIGETGTGKEIIARALHGDRKGKFVSINITALPTELIESELFGHRKGAFTSALEDRIGLMQEATNGTLFLDEIGDMPISAQSKLLRAIQEKSIRRVGDNTHTEINCRIICATHCDLQELIKTKKFREDLFWRLQYYILRTKPLRERKGDIREIIDACFDPESKIAESVLSVWETLELRGNVRELEAMCERYLTLGEI
jgi:transcriptional regulator with PAS, ATPase and Fis domain